MSTGSMTADLLLLAIGSALVFFIYTMKRAKRFFLFDPLMYFWVGALVIYVFESARELP